MLLLDRPSVSQRLLSKACAHRSALLVRPKLASLSDDCYKHAERITCCIWILQRGSRSESPWRLRSVFSAPEIRDPECPRSTTDFEGVALSPAAVSPWESGMPERIRTSDLLLRSFSLSGYIVDSFGGLLRFRRPVRVSSALIEPLSEPNSPIPVRCCRSPARGRRSRRQLASL